ncbi:PP2C family protein-serine/threonine phosphatase [Streptomyces edwardsiae]|uniref:PP2C family protein-serine/threonine phosphatase n=1 Tax=Streptomyces edwardsiae TaxID=3075527 RepID=A0ABU2PUR1_9ACTN|nr:PP2C family protein-serine/threonine phosphatase [Streptomyces sp. DSM 41636]MDT0394754.1 PP2C family protein-serine/threonine phosphatase [Streptomyces sp. DSM 41636]
MPTLVIPSPGSPAHPREADVRVGPTWKEAPWPVVVLDAQGTVVDQNPAARLILTDTGAAQSAVPPWLAEAHRSLTGGTRFAPAGPSPMAAGEIGDRFFEARPGPVADGGVAWWLVDGTGRHRAEASLRVAKKQAEIRAMVSSTLLASLNVPRCAAVAAQLAAEHLADAALLVLPPVGRRHPVTHALRGRPAEHSSLQFDPRGVPGLAETLQGFPPVPARWIDPGALPEWVVPDGFGGPVGSVIVTPLPGHGVSAGALILLRSSTERAFTPDEEAFARLFAARAGAALSAARLYSEQSAITTTLMRELLPPALESLHGVDYAGRYRAASDHERIGGDFYDVHPGADASRETFVVLGDVAGKGLDAAVLTGKIRNTLQALLPLAADHQQVLTLLNGALLGSHHPRFATMVLASVRREDGRVRLRLTSAGHMPPLIVRADGRVEEAATHGTLVGALPSVTVRTAGETLAPGETCLLYTDGITEARGGPLGDELFGEDRLRQALVECAGMPGEAIVERVQMLAAQWLGGGSHDDMATLAISAPRAGRDA